MSGGAPPQIADGGIDDHSIAHLLDHSPPGAWEWFLAHACHSITVIPDMTAERGLNAGEGSEDTDVPAFAPDVAHPFHTTGDSDV